MGKNIDLSRAHGFGAEAKRRQMLGAYLLSSGVYDKYYYAAQKARTLITQDYHAYRALFIAKKLGLDPVAYAPAGESSGPAFRPYVREVAARVWAILDLYLLDTAPKFIGEPVPLPSAEPA